jgi:copper transport protein
MRRRRSLAILLAVLGTVVPLAAAAHGLLRRATPAAGSVLTEVPGEIHLVFTEAPQRVFTRIALFAHGKHPIALDSVEIMPGHSARARIVGALTPGEYRVEWQTAGRDGHPVRGDYVFTIAVGAAGATAAPPEADPPPSSEPAHSLHPGTGDQLAAAATLAAILRWLVLAGVVTAIGAVAFRATVLVRVGREMDPDISGDYMPRALRGSAALGALATGLVLVFTAARLFAQSYGLHGADAVFDGHVLRAMVIGSDWGRVWLFQLAVALATLVAFMAARRGSTPAWVAAGLGAAALALGLALGGHAMAVPRFAAATVLAHVVHTVAASGWLGTLLAIALVGLPLARRLDRDDRWLVIRDIIHTFSPIALVFGGVTVLAGTFIAWTHLGTLPALWTTEYGRVLLAKLTFLTLTAATGAYNWLRVRPALGDQISASRLKRSSIVELVIAALILAATAVLVATPPPMS